MTEADPFGLMNAIMFRLHRDLDGPRDSGRDGWDLCCKALLWFLLSDGFLSFPESSKSDEFLSYLFKKVVNTSRKFSLSEDEVCMGLYALKQIVRGRKNEV